VVRKKLTEAIRLQELPCSAGDRQGRHQHGHRRAVADRKKVESAAVDLALIAGQRPVITKSRKAISTYKLRENQPIGCKVTLRKTRMFEFIDRLINIALRACATSAASTPRASTAAATFRSASRSTSFSPRSTMTRRQRIWGMDITVCTTARTDDEARAL